VRALGAQPLALESRTLMASMIGPSASPWAGAAVSRPSSASRRPRFSSSGRRRWSRSSRGARARRAPSGRPHQSQ
jgi:hypothetical protein